MRKIGIYPGSFDPVHAGHIAFAETAMKTCKLETVVFAPEMFPRNKPRVSPLSERVIELEFTLVKTPFLVAHLTSEQFTVDKTLPELTILYPDSTFTFLIGSDVAVHSLPNWDNLEYIAQTCEFVVGMRASETRKDVRATLETLSVHYVIVETDNGHLSSSVVRQAI